MRKTAAGKLVHWGLSGFLALSLTLPSRAADLLPSTLFDGRTPPEFDTSLAQQFANMFSSCQAGIASTAIHSVGAAFQGNGLATGAGAIDPNACNGPESAPEAESLSCRELSPNGAFDNNIFELKKKQVEAASTTLACKRGKFMAAQSELTCLTNQANLLTQQIASLSQLYQTNISRMNSDVAQMDAVVADRKSQDEEIKMRLNGNTTTGEKGLQQIKGEMDNLVTNEIPQKMRDAEKAYQDLDERSKRLAEAVTNNKVVIGKQCVLTTVSPKFTCDTLTRTPRSFKEYLLCRYEQNSRYGKNGVDKTRGGTQVSNEVYRKAQGKAKQLETVLTEIFGSPQDAPAQQGVDPKIAALAPKVPVGGLQTMTSLTTAVKTRFKDFNDAGFDIANEVNSMWRYCSERAEIDGEKAVKTPGNPLYQERLAIDTGRADANESANTLLIKWAEDYTKNVRVLTGKNYPLDVSACQSANPNRKVGCMRDLQKNIQGILAGTSAYSQTTFTISASNPSSTIKFNCKGINGCISEMFRASEFVQKEQKRIEAFKKDYVQKSNESINNFTTAVRSQLNGSSIGLSNMIKSLNMKLASIGVGQVNIPQVEAEQPEYDEKSGVMKMPKNIVKFIGAGMNPPMLDVTGSTFSEALSGISSGQKELQEKETKVASAMAALSGLKQKCMGGDLKKAAGKLEDNASKLQECFVSNAYCTSEGMEDSVSRLTSTFQELDLPGGDGDGASISEILSNGTSVCKSTTKKYKKYFEELKKEQEKEKPDSYIVNQLRGKLEKMEEMPSNCLSVSNKLIKQGQQLKAGQKELDSLSAGGAK